MTLHLKMRPRTVVAGLIFLMALVVPQQASGQG
jgi:hypothetical protein